MLKVRLFCKAIPKSFGALDHALDDLNQHLQQDVIDGNVRAMITSRRQKVIGKLKLDMTAIHLTAGKATARGHSNIAKEAKEKLLLLLGNSNPDTDSIKIDSVINAIQARQENIIRRAQYVINRKVSFFEETPTLLIESTAGSLVGVQT